MSILFSLNQFPVADYINADDKYVITAGLGQIERRAFFSERVYGKECQFIDIPYAKTIFDIYRVL